MTQKLHLVFQPKRNEDMFTKTYNVHSSIIHIRETIQMTINWYMDKQKIQGVPKGEERNQGIKNLFEEITTKTSINWWRK